MTFSLWDPAEHWRCRIHRADLTSSLSLPKIERLKDKCWRQGELCRVWLSPFLSKLAFAETQPDSGFPSEKNPSLPLLTLPSASILLVCRQNKPLLPMDSKVESETGGVSSDCTAQGEQRTACCKFIAY